MSDLHRYGLGALIAAAAFGAGVAVYRAAIPPPPTPPVQDPPEALPHTEIKWTPYQK